MSAATAIADIAVRNARAVARRGDADHLRQPAGSTR
jgi:hypothetical protein